MATVSTDSSEPMRRVMEISECRPIRGGKFVVALGDGLAFKCGWVVLSWQGLTPRTSTTPVAQTGSARYQQAWQPLSAHHAGSRCSCSIEDG